MAFLVKNLMWILLAFGVLTIAGGFIIIKTNLLQKIRDKMNPNSDKFINAKVFCEDKQIRDRREKIGRYCVQDDQRRMGWHLVHDLLVTAKATGRQFLCLSERNDFPIDFHGVMDEETIAKYPKSQDVFLDSTADIRSQAAKEAAKSLMSNSLSIIALAGALVVVVFAIILFWQSRGG